MEESFTIVKINPELSNRIGLAGSTSEQRHAWHKAQKINSIGEGSFESIDYFLVLEVPQENVANFVPSGHHGVALAEGQGSDHSLLLHGEDHLGSPEIDDHDLPTVQAHCCDIDEGSGVNSRYPPLAAAELGCQSAVVEEGLLAHWVHQHNAIGGVGDYFVNISHWVHYLDDINS